MKKIERGGAGLVTLALAPDGQFGTWGRNGTILFGVSTPGPIYRTSESGGPSVAVTRLQHPAETGHSFPQFLPDGDHFLYQVRGDSQERRIHTGRLSAFESTKGLMVADSAAIYVSSGQLLFVRQKTLLAQNFDLASLSLTGAPFPVADQLLTNSDSTPFSASPSGVVAFRSDGEGPPGSSESVAEFSRTNLGDTPPVSVDRDRGTAVLQGHLRASFSPDGNWIAYQSTESGREEIYVQSFPDPGGKWALSTAGGTQPRWTPDGRQILYLALDGKPMTVQVTPDQQGKRLIFGAPAPSLTPNGRNLVASPETGLVSNTSPISVILNWKPRS